MHAFEAWAPAGNNTNNNSSPVRLPVQRGTSRNTPALPREACNNVGINVGGDLLRILSDVNNVVIFHYRPSLLYPARKVCGVKDMAYP